MKSCWALISFCYGCRNNIALFMGTFNFFYLGVVLFNSRGNTFANNQASREPFKLSC